MISKKSRISQTIGEQTDYTYFFLIFGRKDKLLLSPAHRIEDLLEFYDYL